MKRISKTKYDQFRFEIYLIITVNQLSHLSFKTLELINGSYCLQVLLISHSLTKAVQEFKAVIDEALNCEHRLA